MSDWKPVFNGTIWTVNQQEQPDGRVFEKASRAPGGRILISDTKNSKVLVNLEKRRELGGAVDHRLPGGKVFDTAERYQEFLESGEDILPYAQKSIAAEALEEVGIIVPEQKLEHFHLDVLGATCEWDLHYWVYEDEEFELHQDGAQFHESESDEIVGYKWLDFDQARAAALDSQTWSETRSAAVLLRYLENRVR